MISKTDIQTVLDALIDADRYLCEAGYSVRRDIDAAIDIMQAALAEPEGEPSTVLRLIDTIKYLVGIAERGEGRKARDDELPEQFVLGYVKRLEAALAEPSEPLCIDEGCPHHGTPHICVSKPEPSEPEFTPVDVHSLLRTAQDQKLAREKQLPTDHDCIRVMVQAVQRLRELGWSDIVYCPKDGTVFEAIVAGMGATGNCRYLGDWPKGSWFIEAHGDLWPARPILWKPLPKETP